MPKNTAGDQSDGVSTEVGSARHVPRTSPHPIGPRPLCTALPSLEVRRQFRRWYLSTFRRASRHLQASHLRSFERHQRRDPTHFKNFPSTRNRMEDARQSHGPISSLWAGKSWGMGLAINDDRRLVQSIRSMASDQWFG